MAGEDGVTDLRLNMLEEAYQEVKLAVKSIAVSLNTLTTLEVRHAETRESLNRAFSQMESNRLEQKEKNADYEKRLRAIEEQMPTIKMIRNWVVTGVLGTVSIIGVAAIVLVMKSGGV